MERLEERLVLTSTLLTLGTVSGTYGGDVSISATLTDGLGALVGDLIDFQIGSTDLGTATTNGSGVARLPSVSLTTLGLDAGTYPGAVTADFLGLGPLLGSLASADLDIAPAPIQVVANTVSKVYGQATPTLTGTVTGLLNGDSVGATFTTTASQFSDVLAGGYPITFASLTGAKALDYSTTVVGGLFTPGALNVTPAPLQVVANDVSNVYGQAIPTLTGTVTGLLNGDDVTPVLTTTASQFSDVLLGGYPITLSSLTGSKAVDYATKVLGGLFMPGSLNVTQAPLTIVANDLSKVYGQANPPLTGTVTGLLNGDDVTPVLTTAATQFSDVLPGGYPITLSGLTGSKAFDYATNILGGLFTPGILNVIQAPLTVVANNLSKVYGQANPTLTGSIAGLLNGDDVAANLTTTASQFSDVLAGGYPITLSGLTGSKALDYATNVLGGLFTPGVLNVTQAPLQIVANDASKVYGQVNPTLTSTITGLLDGDEVVANLATTAGQFSDVLPGGYPITLSSLTGSKAVDYATKVLGGLFTPGSLNVTQAPLTIVANDLSKVYGQANPTLTGTVTGLLNGDDVIPVLTTTASQFSDVLPGGYPITLSGLTGSKALDYATNILGGLFTPGILNVIQAPLSIVTDDLTKVYGQANPPLTSSITGLLNGDDVAANLTTTASQFSDVLAGGYPITLSGLTGSKALDYATNTLGGLFTPGVLNVTQAPLTVVANDLSKVYGQANPTLTSSITGLLNGDNVVANLATTAGQFSDVLAGGYPITLSGLSGSKALDYATNVLGGLFTPGVLDVTQAPLTIVANSVSKVYGQADPPLTGSISGLLDGDGVLANFVTPAGQFSDVLAGGYPITLSGLTGLKAGDYSPTVLGSSITNGTLSILPAPLVDVVTSTSKVYGQADPGLTGTVSGILDGDPVSVLYQTAANAASNVVNGGYPIDATGLTGAKAVDYALSDVVPGTLTVLPAPLTIAADAESKVYGQVNPLLNVNSGGFVLGQNAGSLSGALNVVTSATSGSPVGEYPIDLGGLTSANYAINYVPSTLSITPASLVVSAPNVVKVYGQAVPNLAPTYSGFVNGDSAASLLSPTVLSTQVTSATHFGVYPISVGGASSNNYAITYAPGNVAVIPAVLTVIPYTSVKSYGLAVPDLTAFYGGFVNGDTLASLTTPVTLTTPATASSPVGLYPIYATGGSSDDYTIVDVPGTLVIPAPSYNAGQLALVTTLYKLLTNQSPTSLQIADSIGELNQGATAPTVANSIYNSAQAVAYRAHHKGKTISPSKALSEAQAVASQKNRVVTHKR